MPTLPPRIALRLRSLAHVGAARAAASFAALLGWRLRASEPRVCEGSGAATTGRAETGVLFEMEGAVGGVVALLLSPAGREAVVEALAASDCPEAGRSALREAGNIVASQAVSAVADQLGGRITLSVPVLVDEDAGRVLDRLLARRGQPVVTTTELRGPTGEPSALLVFAPDAPGGEASDTVRA
jgi:chemotaxis protein CheY-P-specific phosphatase CheC